MLAAFLGPPPDPRHPGRGLVHQPGQLADEPDMVACRPPSAAQVGSARCRAPRTFPPPRSVRPAPSPSPSGWPTPSPSASTWWTLWMIAMRSSASPSATYISHSGRLRSSGVLAISPINWSSSRRPPGAGTRSLADVVVEVDLVVDHPHRVMQLQRDVDELVAKRRHRLQPRERHGTKQVEARTRPTFGHIQHADLERVHVDFRRLGVQHQRVHTIESLHAHPISSTTRRRVPAIALLLSTSAGGFGESPPAA